MTEQNESTPEQARQLGKTLTELIGEAEQKLGEEDARLKDLRAHMEYLRGKCVILDVMPETLKDYDWPRIAQSAQRVKEYARGVAG